MTFSPFRKLFAGSASRTTTAAIGLSLAAVAVAVYLSPQHGDASASRTPQTPTLLTNSAAGGSGALSSASPSASASSSTTPGAKPRQAAATTPAKGTGHVSQQPRPRSTVTVLRVVHEAGRTRTIVVRKAGSTITRVLPVVTPVKVRHCWDFAFQQDAQTAYVANLSDPGGLDGAVGPHNGDGLACSELPVDAARAASLPVDAYTPPAPASRTALISGSKRYFGVTEDGLPGDSAKLDALANQVGKAPSELGWFSYWDSGFEAAKVRAAWARGALPMITWMSVPTDSHAANYGDYTLANIVAGKFDRYLLQYAGAVAATGLPVAIRFDHEMNGNWYPWSAGRLANRAAAGQPNLYIQAWRHVHDIFDTVGANSNVIWVWAPVRVDNIVPHSTVSGFKYETTPAEDYPGDDYVDWLGTSAYQYKPADGWSYETTFRKTLTALTQLAPTKRIFVAETSVTEAVGNADYAAEKALWTQQTLAGLATEPNVIGFSWFNNTVSDVHRVDGVLITTDWRMDSSAAALAAFTSGIANPIYSSGILPDLGKA